MVLIVIVIMVYYVPSWNSGEFHLYDQDLLMYSYYRSNFPSAEG